MPTATLLSKIHEGRLGSNTSGDRRAIRIYLVQSTERDGDPQTIIDAVGISYLDTWSFTVSDSTLLADSFTCNPAPGTNPNLWHVTIEYSSKTANPDEWSEDPLQRLWRLRGNTEPYKKPAPRDINGVPCRSSAGGLIEGREKDDSRQILEWEVNASALGISTILSGVDCVNDDTFQGYAAGTLKVHSIRFEPMFDYGIAYYHFWLTFHYDPDGWIQADYDRDYFWLDGSVQKRFTDGQGRPMPEPQFLDGDGGRLKDAVTTLNGAINNAVVSATVTSGAVFAGADNYALSSGEDYYISIDDEIMQVTARATNVLTIVRGQKGTSAASHSNGATVSLEPIELNFVDYAEFDFGLFGIVVPP